MLRDKDGHTFFYLHHNNLIFLAVTKRNTNSLMVFSFLYQIIDVMIEYFKVTLTYNYLLLKQKYLKKFKNRYYIFIKLIFI